MLNLTQIIQAWQQRTQRDSPLKMGEFSLQAMRLLGQGQPVSAEQLVIATELPETKVAELLAQMKMAGCEFDAAGHLLGCVLTLNPTAHQIEVNGQPLYAWCAIDTLFLPALLQHPAHIISTCPTTGRQIELTVTPTGITAVEPAQTVVSVIVPGLTPSCKRGAKSGPQGPVCSTMHFFASPEAATAWVSIQQGVAILSLVEAWQLVTEAWLKPLQVQRL